MKAAKQTELDVKKWLDSERAGIDTCGSYEYCAKCDKSLENPCASAYAAANTVVTEVVEEIVAPAKPKAKRTCTRKTVSLEPAVKVEEKKTCKKAATKTTAKKATTTAKKTTTKKASK